MDIPVIDCEHLPEDDTAIRLLGDACQDWGFFQAVNHGISLSVRDQFMEQVRCFFDLPVDHKNTVRRSEENPWGYYDSELTKNTRDWKEIFDFGRAQHDPVYQSVSRWPADLPGFRQVMLAWFKQCERFSFRLLRALCRSLYLPPAMLDQAFADHSSFLRLNYYPPCPDPAPADSLSESTHGNFAVNRHTDAGAITVLVQDDVPALQVRRAGRWHTIIPEPHGLIINIGDMMQVWSNDLYQAPEHRVLANTEKHRFSAPFFFNPSFKTDCVPLVREPARYHPVNWGEFRAKRAAGDYADLGDEIQISHYRIPGADSLTPPMQ